MVVVIVTVEIAGGVAVTGRMLVVSQEPGTSTVSRNRHTYVGNIVSRDYLDR